MDDGRARRPPGDSGSGPPARLLVGVAAEQSAPAWLSTLRRWRVPIQSLETVNQLLEAVSSGRYRAVVVDAGRFYHPWLHAVREAAHVGATPVWLVTAGDGWFPLTENLPRVWLHRPGTCVSLDEAGGLLHCGQPLAAPARVTDLVAILTLEPGVVWTLPRINAVAAAAGIRPWSAAALKAGVRQTRRLLGTQHVLNVTRVGYRWEGCRPAPFQ